MRLVCDVECRGEKRIAALEAENATLRVDAPTGDLQSEPAEDADEEHEAPAGDWLDEPEPQGPHDVNAQEMPASVVEPEAEDTKPGRKKKK